MKSEFCLPRHGKIREVDRSQRRECAHSIQKISLYDYHIIGINPMPLLLLVLLVLISTPHCSGSAGKLTALLQASRANTMQGTVSNGTYSNIIERGVSGREYSDWDIRSKHGSQQLRRVPRVYEGLHRLASETRESSDREPMIPSIFSAFSRSVRNAHDSLMDMDFF